MSHVLTSVTPFHTLLHCASFAVCNPGSTGICRLVPQHELSAHLNKCPKELLLRRQQVCLAAAHQIFPMGQGTSSGVFAPLRPATA